MSDLEKLKQELQSLPNVENAPFSAWHIQKRIAKLETGKPESEPIPEVPTPVTQASSTPDEYKLAARACLSSFLNRESSEVQAHKYARLQKARKARLSANKILEIERDLPI